MASPVAAGNLAPIIFGLAIVFLFLFMAAQYATMVLWASLFIRSDPARRAKHEAWREENGAWLLHYLERGESR